MPKKKMVILCQINRFSESSPGDPLKFSTKHKVAPCLKLRIPKYEFSTPYSFQDIRQFYKSTMS